MSAHAAVAFHRVSFSYGSSQQPLISDLTVSCPRGFTGVVGANGAGKSTLLRLAMGQLAPESGAIDAPRRAIYCAQRTDSPPDGWARFADAWDREACELRGRLNVDSECGERWSLLSHGERKRAQIAHALWEAPELLAIDEPTNHIDAEARSLLVDALSRYPGVGLLVSHDQALLDELCQQCIWLDPPRSRVFSGGYTSAAQQRGEEREVALRERAKVVSESKRLKRETAKRRERAAAEHQARSKRGLSRKDSDAREKIDRARVTDGGAGGSLRQLSSREARVEARLAETQVGKEVEAGIWLDGSRSRRDTVLNIAAGALPLGDGRVLHWPDLRVRPEDRLVLTGPNGAGKSTWLHHIRPRLNVADERVVFLPQEVSANAAVELLESLRQLPRATLGHVMNVVSRLGSKPARLLESRQPSPGEVRKLLLALGIAHSPHVIVMDEPTNHLDLPSIEALQRALADCPCALILVSHDPAFIKAVRAAPWTLEPAGDQVQLNPRATDSVRAPEP